VTIRYKKPRSVKISTDYSLQPFVFDHLTVADGKPGTSHYIVSNESLVGNHTGTW